MQHLSWLEAAVVGLLQGVSELFPVSSLGHSVLLPAVIGGSWARDLNVAAPESPYLAFIVGTHVATALALLVFYWRDWLRLIGGLFSSLRHRRMATPDERLIWQLVVGTIPVGLVGLIFEHWLRTHLGRPGARRLLPDRQRPDPARRSSGTSRGRPPGSTPWIPSRPRSPGDPVADGVAADARLSQMSFAKALAIGSVQVLALGPGDLAVRGDHRRRHGRGDTT